MISKKQMTIFDNMFKEFQGKFLSYHKEMKPECVSKKASGETEKVERDAEILNMAIEVRAFATTFYNKYGVSKSNRDIDVTDSDEEVVETVIDNDHFEDKYPRWAEMDDNDEEKDEEEYDEAIHTMPKDFRDKMTALEIEWFKLKAENCFIANNNKHNQEYLDKIKAFFAKNAAVYLCVDKL